MKNIVIINAYGSRNIGDEAILESSLAFIHKTFPTDRKISVMLERKNAILPDIVKKYQLTTFQLPYGYAIRSNSVKVSEITKLFRFAKIIIASYAYVFLYRAHLIRLPNQGFYSYLSAIRNADAVIGMGGGYLTTNHQVKDYFGLTLTILPVNIAKAFKRPILTLPISFGGFASNRHEKLAYNSLINTTTMIREDISYNRIKKIKRKEDNIKLLRAPDMALFLEWKGKVSADIKFKSNYIVLTAREWMKKEKQQAYEKTLVHLVEYLWKNYQLKTVFIPMASNTIEDDDLKVAKRISLNLDNKHIFSIFQSRKPEDVQKVLSTAKVAMCTRLHSAILSTTVSTPFLTFSYNLKTNGFLRACGIEKWNINIEDVNSKNSTRLLKLLLEKNTYYKYYSDLQNINIQNQQSAKFITTQLADI